MLEILKCYCKYSLKILDNIYNIHRKFSAKVQQISEIRKALDKKMPKISLFICIGAKFVVTLQSIL